MQIDLSETANFFNQENKKLYDHIKLVETDLEGAIYDLTNDFKS